MIHLHIRKNRDIHKQDTSYKEIVLLPPGGVLVMVLPGIADTGAL